MTSPRVLVTGAGGFVGESLILELLASKRFIPVGTSRRTIGLNTLCQVLTLDLNRPKEWPPLSDIQVLVHCAARVHVMNESAEDPLTSFRQINVQATENLARHAASCGVKRFIFISSIKVNGEQTSPGAPFTADDSPAPVDPYGVSKLEAELALMEIGRETGMEIVIIRPPLIYGDGVKANFLVMLKWLNKGVPLPFGAVTNLRSLVSMENLVDLIIVCIDHPGAAGQIFLVSDNEDISTTRLLRELSIGLDKKARLLPVPQRLLLGIGRVLRKEASIGRLCNSLQVDISKTCERLNWKPRIDAASALRRTAIGFKQRER
ncbi:SDR family oxidoreductase [Pseudomonas sp. RGM2987]|uniref:UDP-glucose 4-epimerase family protein n=1 Tax=Pseudomonas sp. RGM2987 TaxID=2930090 RepID=UPI001FD63906|nr:SDR family oxidoreductase [Pseudomonas sp. RGM2987]MCJ8205253.1 SDR family oxidoreductase [Pseudomonas sp. RGM2987]